MSLSVVVVLFLELQIPVVDYRAYLCKLVLIVFMTVTHLTWKSSWSIEYANTNFASSCVQLRVRWGFYVLQMLEPPQSL
jgi:hypothetical protein